MGSHGSLCSTPTLLRPFARTMKDRVPKGHPKLLICSSLSSHSHGLCWHCQMLNVWVYLPTFGLICMVKGSLDEKLPSYAVLKMLRE